MILNFDRFFMFSSAKRGIHIIFFYFSMKTCSQKRLTSNEYPHSMFSWRNKKNISTFRVKKAAYLELCVHEGVIKVTCSSFRIMMAKDYSV